MRIAAVTLLLGSLCLAACNDDNNEVVAPDSRTGVFILQTVNGHGLPAIVLDSITPPLIVEVLSGAIAIRSDNRFATLTGFRLTTGGQTPSDAASGTVATRRVVCTGTFTVARDTLTFVESEPAPECGQTFTGILSLGRLTTSLRGLPAVYVR